MNCTSVYSFFPHTSTMPIEVAMPLYLSRDDFSHRRAAKREKPLRPNLRVKHQPLQQQPAEASIPITDQGRAKKQVSFADHKGLALTKVKVFSEFDDPIDIPVNIKELLSSVASLSLDEDKLILDFSQPSSDYLLFRQRLESQRVCLEHCTLKERALAGTVKVKNLSFEKSVKVRITFDTWKSYTDVECQYVKDTYTGTDRDTFSFEVSLPDQVRPHERIEFAISYEAKGHTYWDSNQGENYRIIQSALKNGSQDTSQSGYQQQGLSDLGIHFDPYGSPRCSHGIFPEWPSYAGYEEIGPYY
ncbi:protein phosphatase 1 regulatory subunit 3B isoform X1 [Megalops cyprinoides]|uniref:protein phosphatase 1 regulatory subunit 3B isoform X1 n=2 Tax=Megalops cyprinoides TaxID=118141 RepID=UPI001864D7D5|nr:protein phosphatase 1 regulatory subunit 3B isoform X1 [Megalops cyprinoides]